jgi:hypothetical protein
MSVAVCKQCGEILHSKHVHDCVVCNCPNKSMLDGGDDYIRKGGINLDLVKTCISMAEARRLSTAIISKGTPPCARPQ